MQNVYKYTFQVLIAVVYLFFCYLMLEITLQYIPYNTDVAFLRIKQDYIHLDYYRVAFFAHVYTSMLVLPAGLTQFSKWIRRKHMGIHRVSGWIYTAVILLFTGPSGLIMAIYANGHLVSQIGFCILAVLWIFFTLMAIIRVRKKDVAGHRAFFIRSFALTLSAITLRAWKYVLVALFHPRPMDVYMIVAWLGWTLNLLIAEIIIYKLRKK